MNTWICVKQRLPPFGIFVEVIFGRLSRKNDIHRGFCCLLDGGEKDGIFWSSDCSDERMSGKFGITHWKEMSPDNLGRIPQIYISSKRFFKIKLKKIKKEECNQT